jgi:hypothetical protein
MHQTIALLREYTLGDKAVSVSLGRTQGEEEEEKGRKGEGRGLMEFSLSC